MENIIMAICTGTSIHQACILIDGKMYALDVSSLSTEKPDPIYTAEGIVFDRRLNDHETSMVEGYLMVKYDIMKTVMSFRKEDNGWRKWGKEPKPKVYKDDWVNEIYMD